MEPDSSQDKKEQAQIEIQKAFKHKKKSLQGNSIEQIDQESWSVSITSLLLEITQNSTGQGAEQSAVSRRLR